MGEGIIALYRNLNIDSEKRYIDQLYKKIREQTRLMTYKQKICYADCEQAQMGCFILSQYKSSKIIPDYYCPTLMYHLYF